MLINSLGDHNHPELAATAGDELLDPGSPDPPLEADGSDEDMERSDRGSTVEQEILMQAAQDALGVSTAVTGYEASLDMAHTGRESNSTPRVRPKILTHTLTPKRELPVESDGTQVKEGSDHLASHTKDSNLVDCLLKLKDSSPPISHPSSSRHGQSNGNVEADSMATSPNLRQYAIPVSEGSPRETLPAIQSSSPQDSSKTPNGQQSLPSLHAQLGSLADPPSTHDNILRSNGLGHQGRQSLPTANGTAHSPPKDPNSSRPSPFTNLQTRANCHFTQSYGPSQPSPASVSPRDPFRQGQDPTSMSPPGKPGPHQLYSSALTPQSDVQTPLSAESHPSASSFSTDTSPKGDRMSIDGSRPVLPPLPLTGPLVGGVFKCEHAGCVALPFQTQYLLK